MTLQERVKNYAKKINDGKITMRYLLGGLGDIENCTVIVEEDIFPEEGGAYCRFLGYSYLFKACPLGMIPDALIECFGFVKKVLSKMVIDILSNKLLLISPILFWLLQKRKFYGMIDEYSHIIHSKTIGLFKFPEKRYNVFATELRRVNKEVFKNETHRIAKPLERIFEVIIFLLEFDTAYRLPAQDVLSLARKGDPIKEFKRLSDILEERFQEEGLKQKSRDLKRLVPILRIPMFKRMLKKFFDELDTEKIKMDEADWYYCLRRKLYNFRGISFEERLKEAEKIDKEKGHIKINIKEI